MMDNTRRQLFQKLRIRKNNQSLQLVRVTHALVLLAIPTPPPKQKSRSAMKVDAMTPHHLRNPRQAGVLHLHLPRSAARQILGPAVVQRSCAEGIVKDSQLAFLAD
jgi:hypothetical protein